MQKNFQSRTVRVFLSSTFRDFAEERDLLVRKVFPELRRKCRERQVELVDVDLRWGITEEEAQQGKVLPICIAEIDRSRPFFMGFIGERYGWVPEKDQYDLSLIMEQSWLDSHRGGKSVTELEMLHGVLNNPAMEDRAFFYFRDPAYSQAKGGAYLSEGPQEKARLEALKDRIRQSGFPVVENYHSPEELAERVRDDLWKLIDEAFPESEVPDALARERMRHEAFTASRLGLYIGGDSYFTKIDSAMAGEVRKPVLVTGDSGGGKSALLANWASRFSQNNPSAILLTHCLATGADAAQPVNMAVRILREISRITGEELLLEGDPRKALHMLSPWLAKAAAFAAQKGGLFVLVLDGLDKMDAQHDMGWWPSMLPEGVGLVASCLSGKVFDAIASRMDWEKLPVAPLQREDCETFIASHLGKYRKSLMPELTSKILAHPLSGNPLFLRTLLEELRVFGVHEELGPKLDHYLTSQTVDDLFERVLERVERDNSPESVRAVLEVLWAAKESFAEDELLAVSGLPPAVWAPIHIALDESLIGAGGRLAFSHDYLRKAVQDRYLAEEKDRKRIRNNLADFCASAMASGRKDLSPYIRRHAVEHFLEVEDWDKATAALSDLEFIEARAIAQEIPAMLTDYAEAVKLLPEGEKERQMEAARHAELDRYAREMHEYAATWTRIREGSSEPEPTLPRPVESVRLWTQEEIAAECNRMTDTPNSLDIVKAFIVFVATNSAPLQQYSKQEGFAANLARNDAPAGPVHEEGKRRLEQLKCIKLIKQFDSNEIYNPLPACTSILDGHGGPVAISACGLIAISGGGGDNHLHVWNLENGQRLKTLKGHIKGISCISLNPDSRFAISGSYDSTLRVWDLESGECLKILNGHTSRVSSVAQTADGRLAISGSADKTLRIWDLKSGECLRVLQGHLESVTSLALNSNGRVSISGSSDKTLRLWNLQSGECLKVINGHTSEVSSVRLSADGRLAVSGGRDNTLRLWNLETGECLKVLPQEMPIDSLALSADARIAIFGGGMSYTINVWNLETCECLKILEGHMRGIQSIALSTDGCRMVSSSYDETMRVWNLVNGNSPKIIEGNTRLVSSLALSDDGRLAISGNTDLEIWNVDTGQRFKTLVGHKSMASSLALSADARLAVSGSRDETLRVWNLETGECIKTLVGHKGMVSSLALSADARLAVSGSCDETLRVWNLETGDCIKILEGHAGRISSLALSANNRHVVSGDISTLRVWNLQTGDCQSVLKGNGTHGGVSLALSADARLAIFGSGESSLSVWNLESNKCINILKGHVDKIVAIAMSTESKIVISGSYDNTIRIWNINSGKCLTTFLARGISHAGICWKKSKLAIRFSTGKVEFYNIENLPLGPFITTAHQEIISEDLPAGPVTARPSCCGQQISIPSAIVDRIEQWAMEGGEGGYTDPALLLDCPNCATPLRMNPFFANL